MYMENPPEIAFQVQMRSKPNQTSVHSQGSPDLKLFHIATHRTICFETPAYTGKLSEES